MSQKGRQQTEELRGLSDEDLAEQLNETYRELFNARLQLATRQMANTSVARITRHKIGRMKTVQRERELAALYQEHQQATISAQAKQTEDAAEMEEETEEMPDSEDESAPEEIENEETDNEADEPEK